MSGLVVRIVRAGAALALIACVLAAGARAAAAPLPSCEQPPPSAATAQPDVAVTIDPRPLTQPIPGWIDPNPAWQPPGGTVSFSIRTSGSTVTLSQLQVAVCFAWETKKPGTGIASPHVWVTESTATEATYNATVPPMNGAPGRVARTALGLLVPLADMRIAIAGGGLAGTNYVVRPIGITSPVVAALLAVAAVLIGMGVFWLLARARSVPGRGWLLWLISTPNGFASLSQLQIMLWTFVVAASAIYVMALSGALIVVTSGTLILLGISGVAVVASQVKSVQDDQKANQPPAAIVAPGPVGKPRQVGDTTESEVRLAWSAPTTGGTVANYRVQYAEDPFTNWVDVPDLVVLPHHTVTELKAATAYQFQVLAVNAGGPSSGTPTATITTKAAEAVSDNAPAKVEGLHTDGPPALGEVLLLWAEPAAKPDRYVVERRLHDSTEKWLQVGTPTTARFAAGGLAAGRGYDFRVAASTAPAGRGKWSAIFTAVTLRQPKWSDLIVSADSGEVDVTRVQMLFFTVVTALFVVLTVMTSYTIPEIPQGFLILMGISNGLYLGSKFVPD